MNDIFCKLCFSRNFIWTEDYGHVCILYWCHLSFICRLSSQRTSIIFLLQLHHFWLHITIFTCTFHSLIKLFLILPCKTKTCESTKITCGKAKISPIEKWNNSATIKRIKDSRKKKAKTFLLNWLLNAIKLPSYYYVFIDEKGLPFEMKLMSIVSNSKVEILINGLSAEEQKAVTDINLLTCFFGFLRMGMCQGGKVIGLYVPILFHFLMCLDDSLPDVANTAKQMPLILWRVT